MTNHNQAPSPEATNHQELLQYTDGEVAVAFRMPGDTVDIGSDSDHKYARAVHGPGTDIAIITTGSGNTYGIAHGFVFNENRKTVHKLPEDTLHVTIGQPLEIPGVTTTTDINGVFLRYKSTGSDTTIEGAEQVPQKGPFQELDKAGFKQLYQQ